MSGLGFRDESGVEDLKSGPELVDLCTQVQDLVLRRDRHYLEDRVGTPRHEVAFHLYIDTCIYVYVCVCACACVRVCA